MYDQPETPIERAVWWTEHVLRHRDSKHLLGVAAQMSWSKYLMLDVLIVLAIGFSVLATIVVLSVIFILRLVSKANADVKVKKQ